MHIWSGRSPLYFRYAFHTLWTIHSRNDTITQTPLIKLHFISYFKFNSLLILNRGNKHEQSFILIRLLIAFKLLFQQFTHFTKTKRKKNEKKHFVRIIAQRKNHTFSSRFTQKCFKIFRLMLLFYRHSLHILILDLILKYLQFLTQFKRPKSKKIYATFEYKPNVFDSLEDSMCFFSSFLLALKSCLFRTFILDCTFK